MDAIRESNQSLQAQAPPDRINYEGVTTAVVELGTEFFHNPIEGGQPTRTSLTKVVIVEPSPRFQEAKIAAAQNGWRTSLNIQNYGDLTRDERYEVAIIAASQDRAGVSFCIQNYRDLTRAQRYALAKIAVLKTGWRTSLYIQNYGDLTQEQRYEVAKIAAAKDAEHTSKYIKNYGDLTQEQRYEVAKIAAAQNGWRASEYIKNYGDLTQEQRYEVAKIAAVQNGWRTSEYIKNYGDLTQEQRYEVAKIAAARSGWGTSKYIKNYGELTQEQRYEVAKIAVAQKAGFTSEYIQNYGNLTQEQRYEVAKIAAAKDAKRTSEYIKNYGELTREQRYEVAKIAAAQNGMGTSENIQNYGDLNDEEITQVKIICSLEQKIRGGDLGDIEPILDSFGHELGLQDFLVSVNKGQKDLAKLMFISFHIYCGREITEREKEALKELVQVRDEDRLKFLLSIFLQSSSNEAYFKVFNQLEKAEPTALLCRIVLAKWSLENEGPVQEILKFIQENKKRFKDNQGLGKDLLNTVVALEGSSALTDIEKSAVLRKMNAVHKDELKRYLSMVQCLIAIGKCKEAVEMSVGELSAFFLKNLSSIFELEDGDVHELDAKYTALEEKMRIPGAIITYLAPLKKIPELKETIREFSKGVLNGEMSTLRYDVTKSEHLKALSKFPEVFKKWQQASAKELQTQSASGETEINYLDFLKQKICTDRHLKEAPSQLISYLQDPEADVDFSAIEDVDLRKIAEGCRNLCRSRGSLEDLQRIVPKDSEFYNDLTTLISPKKRKANIELDLIDTDDWENLFLSGTEAEGSCQRINGSPDFNKCLMGYVIDGKNRMVAIVDRRTGKIIARSIIRLLIQEDGSPAIFQERTYPDDSSPQDRALLKELALQKGKDLGVPVFFDRESPKRGVILRSLGGPAAYEYSDGAAATGHGNIHRNGVFEISV